MRRAVLVLAFVVAGCEQGAGSLVSHATPTSSSVAVAKSPSSTPSWSLSQSPSVVQSPSSPSSPSSTASASRICPPTSIAWTASLRAGSGLPQVLSGSPLFAVLEAKGTTSCAPNTVVISGLDGRARASADFEPLPLPWTGCVGAGPWLPPSAHVAAGKVYFADGTGTIRSLDSGGKVAVVAAIPFSGLQQMLSFAISPDGGSLMAAVFTLPPKPISGDPCSSGTWFYGPGSFTLDVYAGPSVGPVHLLYHQVLSTGSAQPIFDVMAFVGWDAVGPLVMDPTNWQGVADGDSIPIFGTFARADPQSGQMTQPLDSSPQKCLVTFVGTPGDYVCTTGGIPAYTLSIRRPDHSVLWAYTHLPAYTGYAYLSPSESSAAFTVPAGRPSGLVVTSAGSTVSVSTGPLGWLGDQVVIGSNGTDLVYVTLADPSTAVDLGFTGVFVGTISAQGV